MSAKLRGNPKDLAYFRETNPKLADCHDSLNEGGEGAAFAATSAAAEYVEANDAYNEQKGVVDRENALYQGFPVLPDPEIPAAGKLTQMQSDQRHRTQSHVDEQNSVLMGHEKKKAKAKSRLDKCQRANTQWNRAVIEVNTFLSARLRERFELYHSPREFDDSSLGELDGFVAEAKAKAVGVSRYARHTYQELDDETIEALVGPAEPPFSLVQRSYADRSQGQRHLQAELRWDFATSLGALPIAPGVPVSLDGDPVKIAVWLARDRIVEELKRQAKNLTVREGTKIVPPAEYKATLAKLNAEHRLLELEAASAWWRLREAGMDTLPPPAVSARSLLLIE